MPPLFRWSKALPCRIIRVAEAQVCCGAGLAAATARPCLVAACSSSSQLSDDLKNPVSCGFVGGSPPSCSKKRKVKGGALYGSADEVADLQGSEHQDMCLEKRGQLAPLFVKRPTSVQDSSAAPGAAVARRSATMSKKGFACRGCHAPSALTSSAT